MDSRRRRRVLTRLVWKTHPPNNNKVGWGGVEWSGVSFHDMVRSQVCELTNEVRPLTMPPNNSPSRNPICRVPHHTAVVLSTPNPYALDDQVLGVS